MPQEKDNTTSDRLMGEAVIALLKGGGAITTLALIEQLTQMASITNDCRRMLACQQTIREVKQNMSVAREHRQQALRSNDTFFQHFKAKEHYDGKVTH